MDVCKSSHCVNLDAPLPPNVFTVGNAWVIKYLPMWLIAVFAAAEKHFYGSTEILQGCAIFFVLCCDYFFIFFQFRMDLALYNLYVPQLAE